MTRTEEIRARVEKELASELGFFVNEFGWAVRNDEPRGTYEGANGTQYQLSMWTALVTNQAELTALREENERLKGALVDWACHKSDCTVYSGPECNCGAWAALSPAQEQTK